MGDNADRRIVSKQAAPQLVDPPAFTKPGGGTLQLPTNPISAYAQSLRVGKAAYARLVALLPAATVRPIDMMKHLDARRALRELDDALAHTTELPLMADPALRTERDQLKAKRDQLPKDALALVTPPAPQAETRLSRLTLSPSNLSFTTTFVGRSQAQTVVITNDDSVPIQLTPLTTGSGFEGILFGPDEIEPGHSTRMVVTYRPTAAGAHHGIISLDTGGTAVSLPVDGAATALPRGEMPNEMGPSTPNLATHPGILTFTAGGTKMLDVTNISGEPVLVHAVLVHGDHAFTAEAQFTALDPGSTRQIKVSLDQANHAGRETTLQIITPGGMVEVAVQGPRAAPFAPRFLPTLDVAPATVEHPGVYADRVPGSDKIVVKSHPEAPTVSLHNRNKDAIHIAGFHTNSSGKAGFSVEGKTPITIEAGRTMTLPIQFAPSRLGTSDDVFWIDGARGEVLGSFHVHGDARERNKGEPLPISASKAPATSKDKPEAVLAARATASGAATTWLKASNAALTRSHVVLNNDWNKFLSLTSLNPGIPKDLLHGPEVVLDYLGHAFGVFMTEKTALHQLVHGAEHLTEMAAAKVLSAAGATLMATGVGFAVGVLIETAAGLLFHSLVEDPNEAVKKAYEAGQTDGARKVGDAINANSVEMGTALTVAQNTSYSQHDQITGLIEHSATVADLGKMATELTAAAHALDTANPKATVITRDLLALWVRGHAKTPGEAGKDTNEAMWRDAVTFLSNADPDHYFSTGQLKNQPDLFTTQCAAEWSRRGLPMPRTLQANFAHEIGASAKDLADPRQASALAHRFAAQFTHKEFVWDQFSSSDIPPGIREVLPGNFRGPNRDRFDLVTSMPVLEVEAGCCVVKKFLYQVVDRKSGRFIGFRTTPGNAKVEVVALTTNTSPGAEQEFFSPAMAVQDENLHRVIAELEAAGTPVVQLDRTDGNAVLSREFGEEFTRPRTRHFSGMAGQVTVFKAGALHVPDDVFKLPVPHGGDLSLRPGLEVIVRGTLAMLRGGDSVLILRPSDLAAIYAKPNEVNAEGARRRREIEDAWEPHPG